MCVCVCVCAVCFVNLNRVKQLKRPSLELVLRQVATCCKVHFGREQDKGGVLIFAFSPVCIVCTVLFSLFLRILSCLHDQQLLRDVDRDQLVLSGSSENIRNIQTVAKMAWHETFAIAVANRAAALADHVSVFI